MYQLIEYKARTAWNKGKLVGQKPPLKLKEIWAIRIRLQIDQSHRDLALFNLAIDSKLRACDLLKLRVSDVEARSRLWHAFPSSDQSIADIPEDEESARCADSPWSH